MNKYCRKCGKVLVVRTKQVFNPNTGKSETEVISQRCPSRTIFDIFESHDAYDEHGRLHYFDDGS